MQERIRKVAIRHLHPVVQNPHRGAEGLRDAGEAAAGGRVGFEHYEGEVRLYYSLLALLSKDP